MQDTRNVVNKYKGIPLEEIVISLDKNGVQLEIAVENVTRDYNMGTIVRSANAFGVRHVHIIGSRQWNKRGAMMTDKYLHIHYHATTQAFIASITGKPLIAFDNTPDSQPLHSTALPSNAVLLFGAEGPGISQALLNSAAAVVAIEQLGSTRSINVGVAAGIAMYAWLSQHHLKHR
ncbi:MAG: TrmH family RNA methyltransferase [Candidatus Saccharimonas sp.]